MAAKQKTNPPCERKLHDGTVCDGELIEMVDESPRIFFCERCNKCGRVIRTRKRS